MFVYQPTLDVLELKEGKGTDYVLCWKSKGVYASNLKPLYTVFLHSIKLSRYMTRIKFDKDPLAVEQNNYATKIVNAYMVYDLDAWPKNPTNNFKFKNCLFGTTNIVKDIDEEITFDRASFFARNVIIFRVDINSSSHDDNRKNNILVLG